MPTPTDKFSVKNQKLHRKLLRDGVVKIPLLSNSKADQILSVIDEAIPNWKEKFKDQFFLSLLSKEQSLRQQLSDEILNLIRPELNANFEGFRCIVTLVLIKGNGPNSTVDFHQDLTVCDESKFRSYTLWVPITESKIENGAIRFMKQSHKTFRVVRSQTIPAPFDDVKPDLAKFMNFYPVKAGEALLWDQACIHQSPMNNEEEPRLALGLTLIGEDTPLQIYRFESSTNNLEIYSVPDNFWFLYDDFVEEKKEVPKFGKRIGEVSNYAFKNLTKRDIYYKYLKDRIVGGILS